MQQSKNCALRHKSEEVCQEALSMLGFDRRFLNLSGIDV
jgi:hypothetical protein